MCDPTHMFTRFAYLFPTDMITRFPDLLFTDILARFTHVFPHLGTW
jgi:hypothetical protein